MKRIFPIIVLTAFTLLAACKKHKTEEIENRNYKMGFSSWSYGPTADDRATNYDLIKGNGDIISEQMDGNIPWNSWIDGTDLPVDFVADVAYRVGQQSAGHDLMLSISPLNTERNDFIDNWDGSGKPAHSSMNDPILEDAYVAHVLYLIDAFNPDYLIIGMETTGMLNDSAEKWEELKLFMRNVRTRVRAVYPTLKMAESAVLHNWYKPETDDKAYYQSEVKNYIKEMDFAAISFYPFLAGLNSSNQFQKAFDFLHENTTKPIAFVETSHLANDLIVASYDLHIKSSEDEQADFVKALLTNAAENDYMFVIWWSYRDYDRLWETFPEDVKDIGKLWRDTGLEDENGTERAALRIWREVFTK